MSPDLTTPPDAADAIGIAGNDAAVEFEQFESAGPGLERQEQLADRIAGGGRRLLAWRAPQALIAGPGESRLPDFSAAASRLGAEGWPVISRHSGGSASPVSGGTLQIAIARPAIPEITIDSAYMEVVDLIRAILSPYRLELETGAATDTFCPGRYDISIAGRKIAGLSQHWRQRSKCMTVTTAAVLIVDGDVGEMLRAINLFYRLAGKQSVCARSAIGSVRQFLAPEAAAGDSLMDDLSLRIAREWPAR